MDVAKTFAHRLGRDREAPLAQDLQRSDGARAILQLMAAQKRDPILTIQFRAPIHQGPHSEGLAIHVRRAGPIIPIAANLCERRSPFPADRFEHLDRLGPLWRTDGGDTRLDDACFLVCDLGQRVSQQVRVVQTERRDDGYLGHQHVGGVEPATQTNLYDGHIHLRTSEIQESKGGDGLEGGHARRALDQRADLVDQRDDLLPADLPPGHLDALTEGVQMGRGIEPRAVTGGPQTGLDQRCGRALALGARDVHRRETGVRITDVREKSLDAREIERLRRVSLDARLFIICETV